MPQVLESYRSTFQSSSLLAAPRTMLAVRVLCAESEEQARSLEKSFWLLSMKFHDQASRGERNDHNHALSLEETIHHSYSEPERAFLQTYALKSITGTPGQVKQKLEALADCYGVNELMLLTHCPDVQARLWSYHLLAEAFALPTP